MNHRLPASHCFVPLAFLAHALGCTQTDSIGKGGQEDAVADAAAADLLARGTGGAAGLGGSSAARTATGGVLGDAPGMGGQVGPGGTTGAGGIRGTGGASGPRGGAGGASIPADAAETGGDVPIGDASPDAATCKTPNPAAVTCLGSKNQCVPSACYCSGEAGWMCTADCRGNLPLCDGGASPDGKQDAAEPDVAADGVAAEAPPAANYTCRGDSDCCIAIEPCYQTAHLYSTAPAATGKPTFPPIPAGTLCPPCAAPAVQVRCDRGQCVGEKLSTSAMALQQDHCGPIAIPDAGLIPPYSPADAGSQRTSWSCGS
jgi:hypothetical protein